jgi:alpha-N-acetylglucosaminidase
LDRYTPVEHRGNFSLHFTGSADRDTFQLFAAAGKVEIHGSSGVAMASGFYHYLKNFLHLDISWGTGTNGTNTTWGVDNLVFDSAFPDTQGVIVKTSPVDYRYAFNVVSFSYTTPWWDEARWIREIDWMAMHGVNMPLASVGQESLWAEVYRELGMSNDDIEHFFSGPAYLSWQRMGNIHGWAGPLPLVWLERQAHLQKSIVKRMTDLGMQPVLPCFAGHIPRTSYFHFNHHD